MADYTRTSSAPIWIVIVRNVVLSTLAGALFGSFLLGILSALFSIFVIDEVADLWPVILRVLASPLLILYVLPFLLPIVAIVCALAVVFQRCLQKNLVVCCKSAPALIWLAFVSAMTYSPSNSYGEDLTWPHRILVGIISPENLLFLISASFSSFVFYKLSAKGFKW